jgi:ferritin
MLPTLRDALEMQYGHELSNMHRYNAIAAMAADKGFDRIAAYCISQAKGEYEHSQLILKHLMDRNEIIRGPVSLPMDVPSDLITALLSIIDIERATTQSLSLLYDAALEAKEYLTAEFLFSEMLKEQIEEEAFAQTIKDRVASNLSTATLLVDIDAWIGEAN